MIKKIGIRHIALTGIPEIKNKIINAKVLWSLQFKYIVDFSYL